MIIRLKRLIKWLLVLCILFLAFGLFCFYHVEHFSEPFLAGDVQQLPHCKTALVPGTSQKLASGTDNLYFTYRMDAAEKLFKAGKVSVFILSGDNRVHYNEPLYMKKALIKRGVPDTCLFTDYAGLRTFDSMVRCREVFGQDSVIVVSQQFHNARAVFTGRKNGLVAFGFNAQKVTTQKAIKMKFREFFSRMRCVLDIYVLHTQPKQLGEKIMIR